MVDVKGSTAYVRVRGRRIRKDTIREVDLSGKREKSLRMSKNFWGEPSLGLEGKRTRESGVRTHTLPGVGESSRGLRSEDDPDIEYSTI